MEPHLSRSQADLKTLKGAKPKCWPAIPRDADQLASHAGPSEVVAQPPLRRTGTPARRGSRRGRPHPGIAFSNEADAGRWWKTGGGMGQGAMGNAVAGPDRACRHRSRGAGAALKMTEHPEQHQLDRTDIEYTQRLLGERYQLSWIAGRGVMSTVWLARDTVAQRRAVSAILKPEYTESPEFERFRNSEAAEHSIPRMWSPMTTEISERLAAHAETRAVFCHIVMEYVRG